MLSEITLSWDYPTCVLKIFRVQGETFFTNIIACDVEDACRKLRAIRFVHAIKNVSVVNQPLSLRYPLIDPTKDANALIDVTPNPNDCHDCCDFLADQDLSITIGANASTITETPVAVTKIRNWIRFDIDLGTYDMVSGMTDGIEDVGVIFSSVPADQVVVTIPTVTTDCCDTPISSIILLKHNLRVDGEVELQYNPRLGIWQGNIHDDWDVLFEYGCTDEAGGVMRSTNFWMFAMLIKSGGNIVRMLNYFDKGCTGFDFTSNDSAIFYDEAGLINYELKFSVSAAIAAKQTLYIDLHVQNEAATGI